MPLYEYRCRACEGSFHLLRPIASADDPAQCPAGHHDVVRALSLVAPVSRGAGPSPSAGGAGCCGGACGCAH